MKRIMAPSLLSESHKPSPYCKNCSEGLAIDTKMRQTSPEKPYVLTQTKEKPNVELIYHTWLSDSVGYTN